MQQEILIAGSGGQGILLFGKILSYSGFLEGKYVTFTPSYGAEKRGGISNCMVIISSDFIDSPIVKYPLYLIFMSEEAYLFKLSRYQDELYEKIKNDELKKKIYACLEDNIEDYWSALYTHIGRHLKSLGIKTKE